MYESLFSCLEVSVFSLLPRALIQHATDHNSSCGAEHGFSGVTEEDISTTLTIPAQEMKWIDTAFSIQCRLSIRETGG